MSDQYERALNLGAAYGRSSDATDRGVWASTLTEILSGEKDTRERGVLLTLFLTGLEKDRPLSLPYLAGDGIQRTVEVDFLADFPYRGSTCAFCHGDPCAEQGGNTAIANYLARNPRATACPMCSGRPS